MEEFDSIPTQCIVQQVKLVDATKYPLDQIIFVGMSGKMYLPQTIQEVEDEVHSPILQCVLAVSHSREKTKLHWDNKGQIKFLETL